jgi:MFS family permease
LTFNLTVIFAAAFGMAAGGISNIDAFIVIVAFCGFGVGGNIPIDTIICLEVIPDKDKFFIALLSVFQPLGVVFCSLVGLGFVPKYNCIQEGQSSCQTGDGAETGNKPGCIPACDRVPIGTPCCRPEDNSGWRYLLYTLGAISFLILAYRYAFNFQESAKYYIAKGQDDKALKVMRNIARFNGKVSRLDERYFAALEEDWAYSKQYTPKEWRDRRRVERKQQREHRAFSMGGIKRALRNEGVWFRVLWIDRRLRLLSFLVLWIYVWDYWGFSIAGAYCLPFMPSQA